jgi:predicted DNA-binding WGR domain protein
MAPMRLFMQTKPVAAETPRYYQIALQQDLLGGWTLTREWGQQGGRVSLKRDVYLERDDALAAFEHARDAQIKRGFHIMFSQGPESPYAMG